jgi:hypothetical protein
VAFLSFVGWKRAGVKRQGMLGELELFVGISVLQPVAFFVRKKAVGKG